MTKWIDKDGNPWNGSYIVVDGHTIVNPTDEMLRQAGYTDVKDPEPTPEEILDAAKVAKIKAITDYDNSASVNIFYIYEQPMWLDFDERSRISASLAAYRKMGREEMEKVYGDQSFVLPLDTWEDMLSQLEVYASECANVTETHKRNVRYCISVEEVGAYDYTTGYPDILVFKPYPDTPYPDGDGGSEEQNTEE
jgi:hypothetical protein